MSQPMQRSEGAKALAQPVEKPGFTVGLKSVFSAIGWLVTTPKAWPLAAVPLLSAFFIMTGLGVATVWLVPGWMASWVGPTTSLMASVGVTVAQVLGVVLGLIASVLAGLLLAQPVSGPALEALVRRQEEALGEPERPGTSFLLDVWRSVQSLLVGYGIGLPLLGLLALLALFVPMAAIVLFPFKLVVAAMMVAWDICDYPLTVRGLPVRDRVRVLARHKTAVLGFGLALALAGLLPLVLFLLLPAGVAAAARLVVQIERYEAAQGRDIRGAERPALDAG